MRVNSDRGKGEGEAVSLFTGFADGVQEQCTDPGPTPDLVDTEDENEDSDDKEEIKLV